MGPPLGGLLVAAGAALAFGVPGALWALAAVMLLGLPGTYRTVRTTRTTLRADVAEGLRFLWHDRILRTLAMMVGGINFASNAAFAVFVLYAVGPDSPLGLSEPAYGVLLTATAVGAFAGSFVAERVVGTLGRARSLTLTTLGTVAFVGVPAVTTNAWVIGAVSAVGGAGIAVWNVVTLSLRQRITPDALLGRLNACYRLLAWGRCPWAPPSAACSASSSGCARCSWSWRRCPARRCWGCSSWTTGRWTPRRLPRTRATPIRLRPTPLGGRPRRSRTPRVSPRPCRGCGRGAGAARG